MGCCIHYAVIHFEWMNKKRAAFPEQLFQQLAAFEPFMFRQCKTLFDGVVYCNIIK